MFLNGQCFEVVGFLAMFLSSINMDPQVCIDNRSMAGSLVCCANYYTNEKGECSSCAPGFYGDFCEKSCPPGTFGEYCGGQCISKCSVEECDPVKGCSKTNTDVTDAKSDFREKIKNITTNTIRPLTSALTIRLNTNLSSSTASTTMSFIWVPTESNGEFYKYLLIFMGIVISLLLIVVITQLRLRLKFGQGRISNGKSADYRDINNLRNMEDVYQSDEPGYQEIEQCFGIIHNPNELNIESSKTNLELSGDLKKYYLSPISGQKKSDKMTKDKNYQENHKSFTGGENNSLGQTNSYDDIKDKFQNSDTNNIDTCSSVSSDEKVSLNGEIIKPEVVDGSNGAYLHVIFN